MKPKWILAVVMVMTLVSAQGAVVTFSEGRLASGAQNRLITISLASDPLAVTTNIVFGTPMKLQPVGGVVTVTNLVAANYWVRIDGVEKPMFMPVPDSTNTYNAVDLITDGLKHMIGQTNYVLIAGLPTVSSITSTDTVVVQVGAFPFNAPRQISGSGLATSLSLMGLASTGFVAQTEAPLASTNYVNSVFAAALAASVSGVASVNGRTGAVSLVSGDVTGALGFVPVTPSQFANALTNNEAVAFALHGAVTINPNLGTPGFGLDVQPSSGFNALSVRDRNGVLTSWFDQDGKLHADGGFLSNLGLSALQAGGATVGQALIYNGSIWAPTTIVGGGGGAPGFTVGTNVTTFLGGLGGTNTVLNADVSHSEVVASTNKLNTDLQAQLAPTLARFRAQTQFSDMLDPGGLPIIDGNTNVGFRRIYDPLGLLSVKIETNLVTFSQAVKGLGPVSANNFQGTVGSSNIAGVVAQASQAAVSGLTMSYGPRLALAVFICGDSWSDTNTATGVAPYGLWTEMLRTNLIGAGYTIAAWSNNAHAGYTIGDQTNNFEVWYGPMTNWVGSGTNVLFVDLTGINDSRGYDATGFWVPTAGQAFAASTNMWSRARAKGATVFAATVPASAFPGTVEPASFFSFRTTYNSAVLGTPGLYDGLADLRSVFMNPQNTSLYQSSDELHPTTAGHVELARLWMEAISSSLSARPSMRAMPTELDWVSALQNRMVSPSISGGFTITDPNGTPSMTQYSTNIADSIGTVLVLTNPFVSGHRLMARVRAFIPGPGIANDAIALTFTDPDHGFTNLDGLIITRDGKVYGDAISMSNTVPPNVTLVNQATMIAASGSPNGYYLDSWGQSAATPLNVWMTNAALGTNLFRLETVLSGTAPTAKTWSFHFQDAAFTDHLGMEVNSQGDGYFPGRVTAAGGASILLSDVTSVLGFTPSAAELTNGQTTLVRLGGKLWLENWGAANTNALTFFGQTNSASVDFWRAFDGTGSYVASLDSQGRLNANYIHVLLASPNTTAAFNSLGDLTSVATTPTELGYVHNVTSSIQAQLNALASAGGGNLNAVTNNDTRSITLSNGLTVVGPMTIISSTNIDWSVNGVLTGWLAASNGFYGALHGQADTANGLSATASLSGGTQLAMVYYDNNGHIATMSQGGTANLLHGGSGSTAPAFGPVMGSEVSGAVATATGASYSTNAFDATTNVFGGNIVLGQSCTTNFSGNVTISGLTSLPGSTERAGRFMGLNTDSATHTVTTPASWRCSDYTSTHYVTNGFAIALVPDVLPGQMTNCAVAYFK